MLSWLRRPKPVSVPPSPTASRPIGAEDSDALRKRGNLLLQQGQLAAAEEAYRQAAALDPTNKGAWVNLGFMLSERGELAAGKDALERATILDPTDADAQYLLGRVKVSFDDQTGGIANFNRALEARPEFEPCRRSSVTLR